jgi:hypothetical protein
MCVGFCVAFGRNPSISRTIMGGMFEPCIADMTIMSDCAPLDTSDGKKSFWDSIYDDTSRYARQSARQTYQANAKTVATDFEHQSMCPALHCS